MNPVSLREPTQVGWESTIYAKDQPQYRQLPAVVNVNDPRGTVISEWEPDDGEMALLVAMIAEGKKPRISLKQLTFRQPLQPVLLQVGSMGEPYVKS
jgi:hypothetical protein